MIGSGIAKTFKIYTFDFPFDWWFIGYVQKFIYMGYSDQSSAGKRVVVVGANGRLGHLLVSHLGKAHQVVGLTREHIDLRSGASIVCALGPLNYDRLIIPGAVTGVDYCETHGSEAFAVNAEAAGVIAEISEIKGAHVTYISTDMVFDGLKSTPYVETDPPGPISIYGSSKLKGEQYVLGVSAANLVVRISWLYGPGKPAFPEWIIDRACSEVDLALPGDKICCPTYSADLVRHISELLVCSSEPAGGVFHVCNSEPCSWRDWGQYCVELAREAGLPVISDDVSSVSVNSVEAFVAKRPLYSAMSTEKFKQFTGITPRIWKDALREFLGKSELFERCPDPMIHQ